MMKTLKYKIIGASILILGGIILTASAQVIPFTSKQLAPTPANGNCLVTNGSINSWTPSCGSGSGGGVGSSTNPFMATYYVATSTTATSTFAGDITFPTAYGIVIPRQGTASSLAAVVPLSGQYVYETDTRFLKIGDGSTSMASLFPISPITTNNNLQYPQYGLGTTSPLWGTLSFYSSTSTPASQFTIASTGYQAGGYFKSIFNDTSENNEIYGLLVDSTINDGANGYGIGSRLNTCLALSSCYAFNSLTGTGVGGMQLNTVNATGLNITTTGASAINAQGRMSITNISSNTNPTMSIGGSISGKALSVTGTSTFTGNVGIGTSTPYAPLSVVGSGGIIAENITATGTSAVNTFAGVINVTKVATSTISGNLQIGRRGADADSKRYALRIETDSSGGATNLTTNASVLLDAGSDDAGSEPWYIKGQKFGNNNSIYGFVGTAGKDSEGNTYTGTLQNAVLLGTYNDFGSTPLQLGVNESVMATLATNGNFGIGLVAPAAQLDIQGSGTGHAMIGNPGISGYTGISFNGTLSSSNYNFLGGVGDPSVYFNAANGGAIIFRIANFQAPNALLMDASGGYVSNKWAVGTSTAYSKLSAWGTGTGTGGLFELTNNASTSVMKVLDNGNVGIGTTSPYAKLSVNGQTASAYFTATTSTASTLPYASTTALTVSGTGYFPNSGFWNSTGIAVNNSQGVVYAITLPSGTNSTIGTQGPNSLTGITLDSADGTESMKLYSGGVESMRIDENQSVGIGTTTNLTAGTLTVQGRTRVQQIVGAGNKPTIAAGTGAGTTPTISVAGTDIGGVVSVTTGSLPVGTNATVATITYSINCPADSYVTLYPDNANTALLSGVTMVYVNGTASTFVITSGTTALTAATAYAWDFLRTCI